MPHTIIVETPYFVYTSHHSSYQSAMAEFSILLEQKKSHQTKFQISVKPYLLHPVTMVQTNVA